MANILKMLKEAKVKIEKMVDLIHELGQAHKYTKELKENKEQLAIINQAIENEKSKPKLTAEVKKAIETVKGATKAEFKGIVDASLDLEKQIGDLKLKGSGKSKNEGNVKIELDAKSLLLMNGLKVLMEAGFISTSDFSLSASIEEEFGDLKASLKSELKGLAEVQGKLTASASVLDLRKGVLLDVLIKAEAGFKLNLTGTVKGELSLEDKLKLTASITGELNIEGSAVAEGEVKLTIKAVSVKGKAEAKAEASAVAKAIVGVFTFKDIFGVELEGGVKGEAKAEATAEGEFTIDLEKGTIAIGGKVSALASVGAKVYSSANFLIKGQRVIKLQAEAGISEGVGGSAGGAFEIKDGKLLIHVDLGAAFEAGGEGAITIEIDLKTIGTIIKDAVTEKYKEWSDVKIKDGKVYIKLENDEFDTPVEEDFEGKAIRSQMEKVFSQKNILIITKLRGKKKGRETAIKAIDKLIAEGMKQTRIQQTHLTEKRLASDEKVSRMVDKVINEVLEEAISNANEDFYVAIDNQKVDHIDGWNNKLFED